MEAKPSDQSRNWSKTISVGNEKTSENVYDDQSEQTPLINTRKGSPSPSQKNSLCRGKKLKFVEPIAAIYLSVVGVMSQVSEQYVYLRISETFGNNYTNTSTNSGLSELCNANRSSTMFKIQQETQSATSSFMMYLNVLQILLSAIPTIMAGNLVDRFGRRIALYLCFCSRLFYVAVIATVIAFKLPLNVLYAGAIVDGMSGSTLTAMMAFSTYIADITMTSNNRGFRMTVLECIMGFSAALCIFGAGILIDYTNFFIPSMICLFSIKLGLIYIRIFLAESYEPSTRVAKWQWSTLKRSFTIFSQDTSEKRRSRLLLGLVGIFFTVPSVSSSGGVFMLYVLNLPFCWTSKTIGIFISVQIAIRCFCAVVLVKLMQGYISDIGLAILGNVSNFIYYIFIALARNNTFMYIATALGILASTVLPNARSAMSKLVSKEEHGPLFASVSFIEMASTTSFVLIFNTVYSVTLSIMPGIVFFLLAGMMAIALISFIVYEIIGRKRLSYRN